MQQYEISINIAGGPYEGAIQATGDKERIIQALEAAKQMLGKESK